MANADAARGFEPVRHLSGGVIRTNEWQIADGGVGDIFTGDMVKLMDTGTILVAAATNRLLGVFAGCKYTTLAGNVVYGRYWPSTTALKTGTTATAYIYDDPNIVFSCQSAGTPAQTNIGNLADHVVGTGSTNTGQSGSEVSGTMAATVAALRIIDLVRTPDNAFGLNANLLVTIHEHEHSRNESEGV